MNGSFVSQDYSRRVHCTAGSDSVWRLHRWGRFGDGRMRGHQVHNGSALLLRKRTSTSLLTLSSASLGDPKRRQSGTFEKRPATCRSSGSTAKLHVPVASSGMSMTETSVWERFLEMGWPRNCFQTQRSKAGTQLERFHPLNFSLWIVLKRVCIKPCRNVAFGPLQTCIENPISSAPACLPCIKETWLHKSSFRQHLHLIVAYNASIFPEKETQQWWRGRSPTLNVSNCGIRPISIRAYDFWFFARA